MFFNPVMAFDRDLGVSFARALAATGRSDLAGWEMMSATGVRGLRLARESSLFRSLLLTEQDPSAAALLSRNVERAGVPGLTARRADARLLPAEAPFDFVDVDPYGSPLPFLGAMFSSLRLPAIVGVAATDMMVLAGAIHGACERRYGARPIHGRLAMEGGLRILLALLSNEARRRERALRPLLCYVHDHHVRAYVEVLRGEDPPLPDPVARVRPDRWAGPPLGPQAWYGPLWLGPLFDANLVAHLEVPPTAARHTELKRWIARVQGEASVDVPFYYEPNEVARAARLPEPPPLAPLLEELGRRGARAARAHPREAAFRTDAPRSNVEEAARTLGRSR